MTNFFEHSLIINKKQTLIDITSYINDNIISLSKIQDGIVIVYCPHTTAGITINENADPNVVDDLIYGYEKAYPSIDSNYKHFESNSHAHLKSSCIGASQTLILNKGKLVLGMWQDIYFCEFNGPRNRTFYVKIIEG